MVTRRVRPLIVVALAALALGTACGGAAMSDAQATEVAVAAFRAAGLSGRVSGVVKDATVDRAGDGKFIQVHQVAIVVDGVTYQAGVSKTAGAVVRLKEPQTTKLTDRQIRMLAAYRDNSSRDAAKVSQTVIALVVLVLSAAATAVALRQARLRAEAAAAQPVEAISLD